jgi:hypothetical protein
MEPRTTTIKSSGGKIVFNCPSSCNWNKEWADLKEYQVHLVGYIKRRTCGIASAGLPLFSI